ncbi:MAG: type II secretion system inner membrane protein GspF [Pseudomonadota bacterium]
MAAFEYVAIGPDGRRTSGTISADTARSARKELRLRQLTPLKVSEASERSVGRIKLGGRGGLNGADRVLVTRQLAMLIQSGATVEEALAAVASEAERPAARRLLLAVRASVTEGYRFSEALAQSPSSFPALYRSVVGAGEASGRLGEVMERLAVYLEKSRNVGRKVQAALIYPCVLAVIALVVIGALMTFVVPRVVEQFNTFGEDLPPLTNAVIAVSEFVRNFGLIAVAGVIVFVFLAGRALKSAAIKRQVDATLLSLPVIGKALRTVSAARFARTFSTLLASGTPVLDSLAGARGSLGNLVFAEAVDETMTGVREGGSLARAMRKTDVFPALLTHLAASGETGGDLAGMMAKGAEYLEEDFESSSAVALGLLEPLIIVFLGGVVALIVLSIMLPILQLNTLALN